MKRVVAGWVLLLVGAFLFVPAVIFATFGSGLTERTPLDVDSNTYLSGEAQKLNAATGKVETVPVKVYSSTKVDPKKSDSDVVVFVNATCVNVDENNPPPCLKGTDKRVVTNSIDTFATDRHTGVAVDKAKYGTADSEYRGLVNKFPFNTKKLTYQYWDGVLGETVAAKYVKTTKIQGLKTYEFKIEVPATEAIIIGDVKGTYQTDTSLWVEPKTGAIIDQHQHETRLLPDGTTALDLNIKFTPKTVTDGVKQAEDSVGTFGTLTLTGKIIPIGGGILGILGLVIGAVMVRSGQEESKHTT